MRRKKPKSWPIPQESEEGAYTIRPVDNGEGLTRRSPNLTTSNEEPGNQGRMRRLCYHTAPSS